MSVRPDPVPTDASVVTFETAIATNQVVEAVEGGISIGTGDGRMGVDPGASAVSFETHGYSDHTANPTTITRIVLKPKHPASSGEVRYSFSPAC